MASPETIPAPSDVLRPGAPAEARQRPRAPRAPAPEGSLARTAAAFLVSRLAVWAIGCGAVLVLGTVMENSHRFDSGGISRSLGPVGNLLVAPAVRWDAVWYLDIAQHGYRSVQHTGFFPLYPLLIRAASYLTGSYVLAGILISLVSLLAGLEIVRRLTELELGERVARLTVLLIAFGPLAVLLSAVYTEPLFLALSAGCLYAARRGRWALAGISGALAALTRVDGVLLLLPLLVLFFYGPRTDAAPWRVSARWRPRHRFSAAVVWSACLPAAVLGFEGYLALRGLGWAATLHAQQLYWSHQLVVPVVGLGEGLGIAWQQLVSILTGVHSAAADGQGIFQVCSLAVAALALVAVFRRLPLAYGLYVVAGFLWALATPTVGDPLLGFDRYASMRFPLFMGAAAWALQRGHPRKLLALSTAAMAVATVQFSIWVSVGAAYL